MRTIILMLELNQPAFEPAYNCVFFFFSSEWFNLVLELYICTYVCIFVGGSEVGTPEGSPQRGSVCHEVTVLIVHCDSAALEMLASQRQIHPCSLFDLRHEPFELACVENVSPQCSERVSCFFLSFLSHSLLFYPNVFAHPVPAVSNKCK